MNKLLSICFLTLLISGCASVGLSALNATAKFESQHEVVADLAYGEQEWHKLDVHQAKQVEAESDPKPVLIFFYGGAWESGQRDEYYFAASAFVDHGYVVVVPDYVKFPTGKFPTFIEDGAKAFAWTKENIDQYGGDPDNIFIAGHSAGAHLGALLAADRKYLSAVGYEPRDIRGFAGLAGPYNFTPEREPFTLIFGPEENFPKMQIRNFVDGDEPPMILLHGTKDKTVGILNTDSLIESIEKVNGDVQGVRYEGVSHVGILLTLHPALDGDEDAAMDIDQYFRSKMTSESRDSVATAKLTSAGASFTNSPMSAQAE